MRSSGSYPNGNGSGGSNSHKINGSSNPGLEEQPLAFLEPLSFDFVRNAISTYYPHLEGTAPGGASASVPPAGGTATSTPADPLQLTGAPTSYAKPQKAGGYVPNPTTVPVTAKQPSTLPAPAVANVPQTVRQNLPPQTVVPPVQQPVSSVPVPMQQRYYVPPAAQNGYATSMSYMQQAPPVTMMRHPPPQSQMYMPPQYMQNASMQYPMYSYEHQTIIGSAASAQMLAANQMALQNAYLAQLARATPKVPAQYQLGVQEHEELRAERATYTDEAGDDLEEEGRDGSDTSYLEYKPKKFHLGKPHPDVLVESASLSATDLPDVRYKLVLPKELINSGLLSAPQLETVCYSSQIHEEFLPLAKPTVADRDAAAESKANNKKNPVAAYTGKSAMRKGFFLGDGAGVGKGRQLAGIIYENWLQGRRRHLWFSASADLHLDARRDLDDIGAEEIDCHKQLTVKGKRVLEGDGVIFSTYNGLIATSKGAGGSKKRKRRIDQMIKWCGGEDFDGCIMLDECHKAKNLIPSKTGMKPTQMGLAVKEIQERLPRARVVYCSATGCSEPADMAYMIRLGLWGPKTSFPGGFDSFRKAFERGGVGMMELVAMHLKRQGQYICRTLSYHGCNFHVDEQALDAAPLRMYDDAAKFWIRLYEQLVHNLDHGGLEHFRGRKKKTFAVPDNYVDSGSEESDSDDEDDFASSVSSDESDWGDAAGEDAPLKVPESDARARQTIMRYFWNAHQRFFRSLCISLKVPRTVQICKEAIAAGKCVVIGLQTTGQAGADAVHGSNSPDARRMQRELSDLSVGDTGDVSGDGDDAGQEFASAPAATLRRVIYKLFPLPKPPASVLQARKEQRALQKQQGWEADRRSRRSAGPQVGLSSRSAPKSAAGQLKRKFNPRDSSDEEDLFTDSDSVVEMLKNRGGPAGNNKRQRIIQTISADQAADISGFSEDESSSVGATVSPAEKNASAQIMPPFKAPRGRAKGYNGWSIFRSEGWLLVNSADAVPHASDVQEILQAQKTSLGAARCTTEFVTAVTREAASGAKYVNRTICKTFKRTGKLRGEIVAYLPPSLNDGEELWHVVFSDLDEEDWDADELEEGLAEFEKTIAAPPSNTIANARGRPPKQPLAVKATAPPPARRTAPNKRLVLSSSEEEGDGSGGGSDSSSEDSDFMLVDSSSEGEASDNEEPSSKKKRTGAKGVVSNSNSKSSTSVAKPSVVKTSAEVIDLRESKAGEDTEVDLRSVQSTAASEASDDLVSYDASMLSVPATSDPSSSAVISKASSCAVLDTSSSATETLQPSSSEPESAAAKAYREAGEKRQSLLAAIEALSLPGNPLDVIIDSVGGPAAVAEMTGRQSRLVRDDSTGKLIYAQRNQDIPCAMNQRNIYERDLFLQGEKRIAIISEAASAGISLHADRRVKNQCRRVHITLELPWSADRAVQQLGRSHRSNQSSGPEYYLLISPQGGERRFAAAVAKRLESLGALTQGDRSASVGAKNMSITDFNFDTKYGKKALTEMFIALSSSQAKGVNLKNNHTSNALNALSTSAAALGGEDGEDNAVVAVAAVKGEADPAAQAEALAAKKAAFAETATNWLKKVDVSLLNSDHYEVPRFLNRILGIPSKWQRKLFDLFSNTLESLIRQAKREMSYDQGIMEIRGKRIEVQPGYPQLVWGTSTEGPSDAVGSAVVYPVASTSARKGGSSVVSAGSSGAGGGAHSDERVMHYVVKVDRGCKWEDAAALLDQAKSEEALAQRTTSHSTSRSSRAEPNSMSGYHITRNAYQGKYFICLILEKSYINSKGSNVIIVRPTTGRNEMNRMSLKEKYRPLADLKEARRLWDQQYEESGQPGDNGLARRYLLHHLLTGSVLAVWSKIEAVYAMYNSWNANTTTETQKRFALRVARVCINTAGPDGASDSQSPVGKGANKAHAKLSQQSSKSSKSSKEGSQSQTSQLESSASAESQSLVGIWVPATRIGEVLKALKKQREAELNAPSVK